jgi:CheY-like chemotaxis protein
MVDLSNHTQGMILVVGPTGSGKTTTIYSLLTKIDCKSRSLLSVEDPIEYNIPYANQQQANEKAGITFDLLVKSAVRQDPDILFLGEVRDLESAKIAVDFASTGHMTISTLHTSNATTALFRLERLGVKGATMADSVLAVIAQRLVKKLCDCRKIEDITPQEEALLSPFTADVPKKVARPGGCQKCKQTGYAGRVGVYEILQFDKAVAQMIRESRPIAEIRQFVRGRGDYLLSNHAIDHVRSLIFTPQDAYDNILVEEVGLLGSAAPAPGAGQPAPQQPPSQAALQPVAASAPSTVLVVDDDPDMRALISKYLESAGYAFTMSGDGIDALMQLGARQYDLILSDINMPHLDGFKLVEMIGQKGIRTPVIFITGSVSEEGETRGLELGAADFIKKPVRKDVLLMRIKNILNKR